MSRKILVVEDHHDTSFALCRILQSEGYTVQHAIDGKAGYITAMKEFPDLVITDINMPRMDGIELTRALRNEDGLKETPIIVMSAYGKRIIDDAMSAGATGYIEKPINVDKFLTTVKDILP